MKRLVVCCDGTWNQPDQRAGGAPRPTNVVKFSALVQPRDGSVEQRLLYHQGIGSTETAIRKWIEGATGLGITRTLVDCYRWLIRNYAVGDELFFFGFSRGAYTARSLAGFVRNSGILRPDNEDLIHHALALYRSRNPRYHPRAAASRLFRQSYAWSLTTPIKCVGVWDTVGALGVPNTIIQGILKHLFRINREFHDTDLSSTVAHGFHAVAIDEERKPFLPTLWTQTDDGARAGQHLEQLWFAGTHSNVGGGSETSELSDITLAWMADRAILAGLSLLPPDQIGPPDFARFGPSIRGPITTSMTPFYRLFGRGVRRIGDPGAATHEVVSTEARVRWGALPTWRPRTLVEYAERHADIIRNDLGQ